ncbi:MAG: PqqD family protein [Trueperaceae bacterium]
MEQEPRRRRIPSGVRATVEGDSILLLSPKGDYFGLDDLGARVWQAVERNDLEATMQKLSEAYRAPPEIIARDVRSLLEELRRAGLLSRDQLSPDQLSRGQLSGDQLSRERR